MRDCLSLALLGLGLATALPFPAQAQSTVTRKVFTAITTTQTSASLPNINQNQHTLRIIAADSGGSCAAGSVTAPTLFSLFLEGSNDAVSWYPVTPRNLMMTRSGSTWVGSSAGSGVYPYIRANYANAFPNCAVTAYYMGSVQSTPWSQTMVGQFSGYLSALYQTSIATKSNVVFNLPALDFRISLYGYQIHNPAGTSQTVRLYWANITTACNLAAGADVLDIGQWTLTGNQSMILPTSQVPYAISPPSWQMCVETTAASATQVTVQYRVE